METKPAVRSLDRGLRVLDSFTPQRPQWTVSELARELEVPLASTHRIVSTLERAGYLERARARGPLRLGLRLLYLGSVVQSAIDTREVARPYMRQLATGTGETAVLSVAGRDAVVCVEHVDGTYPIRPRSLAVGDHGPYNGGAIGLVLLAHLSAERRAELLGQPLEQITGETLIRPDEIEERCVEIRRKGIDYSEGEVIAGTAALAVPLFGVGGRLEGALALTGVIDRFRGKRRGAVEQPLRQAAEDISRQLGFVSGSQEAGAGG